MLNTDLIEKIIISNFQHIYKNDIVKTVPYILGIPNWTKNQFIHIKLVLEYDSAKKNAKIDSRFCSIVDPYRQFIF